MSNKSRNSRNIESLRVREETVQNNDADKPGTSVIVQQPQAPSPNIDVMAYRLEQNELATRELKQEMSKGFSSIKDQIIEFTNNFATHEQLKDVEDEAAAAIKRIEDAANKAINKVSDRVTVLENNKLAILTRISIIAIGILVAMLLALYGLDKFL